MLVTPQLSLYLIDFVSFRDGVLNLLSMTPALCIVGRSESCVDHWTDINVTSNANQHFSLQFQQEHCEDAYK